MGLLRIVAEIMVNTIEKINKRVINALVVLDNLGIDAHLWHRFEQANFNVIIIIKEVIKIAKVHTKVKETDLSEYLSTTFEKINFLVFVNGSEGITGFRKVINIGSETNFTIEFHTTKLVNVEPLKLSAILARGNFKNNYDIFTTLFVKVAATSENNFQFVKLINTNMLLQPPHKWLLLKTGLNEIIFFMKSEESLNGSIFIEKAFNWWSNQKFDVLKQNFFFTKKTRETIGEMNNINVIASIANEEGYKEVKIRFNFQPSEWDYSHRRQIKLKCGRELMWSGGKERLSLDDLVNIYNDFSNAMAKKHIYDDLGELVVIGNKNVTTCISLSNRSGHQCSIELKRLVREWVIYCVIREKLLSMKSSIGGISGIRTFNRSEITNRIYSKLEIMNLPTNNIRLYEYFQNLESLGFLNYRGSKKGFTVFSFQFDFEGVDISDLYMNSVKKLYDKILERSPSNFPSYFEIHERALIKGGIIKNSANISATNHFEVVIGHDNRGYVVKRLKELKADNILYGNKNVISQLMKVLYEDLKDSHKIITTLTNKKLKDIWDQIKEKYSFLHEHKKHSNGLKPQADAFIKLIDEMNSQGISLPGYLKNLRLKKNDTGPFREFAGNVPNLGYDVINTKNSPKLFSGHGKGINSIKNVFFSVILDLSCLIFDNPKKTRVFYWANEDTISNITRLNILVFSGEEFKQITTSTIADFIDLVDGSFCTLMKLYRLLTKKTRYYLQPNEKIIRGKIDSRVINLVENDVLNRANFSELFTEIDETTLTTILKDYQKKWRLLIKYLDINIGDTTYNELLDHLVNILYDFYYLRLLSPDLSSDSCQQSEKSSINLDKNKKYGFSIEMSLN